MEATRIALDVMGGDDAPRATLKGALLACDSARERPLAPERIVLVGDEPAIRAGLSELRGEGAPDPGFELVHAAQVIAMDESPAVALRAKPDSSIARCVETVRAGRAGALVSMGNTGAVVAAATLGLRTLAGVRRPGIAVTLALTGQHLTIIDMGANIAPKPEHLLQYGMMGAAYMRACIGVRDPRVGLLNVGEEASKGTDLLKETHRLLSSSRLSFAGNVEGGDLFLEKVDVVVTDGLTGNVVLKLLEGFSGFMLGLVLSELKRHGVDWAPDVLRSLERKIDYAEYGGALLLGVAGAVVIGHGRSDANAVANALGLAARALDAGVNQHIVRGLEQAREEAAS